MFAIIIWPIIFLLPYFIEYQFYPEHFPINCGILTVIWLFVSLILSFIIEDVTTETTL